MRGDRSARTFTLSNQREHGGLLAVKSTLVPKEQLFFAEGL